MIFKKIMELSPRTICSVSTVKLYSFLLVVCILTKFFLLSFILVIVRGKTDILNFVQSNVIPISVGITAAIVVLSYLLCRVDRHFSFWANETFLQTFALIQILFYYFSCICIVIFSVKILRLHQYFVLLVLQVLSGGTAICYFFLFNKSPMGMRSLLFSCFYAATMLIFLLKDQPEAVFFFLVLFFFCWDWSDLLVLFLLIDRCFILEGGFLLIMQIGFLYCYTDNKMKENLFFFFPVYLIFLYTLSIIYPENALQLQYLLSPLSGASGYFFFHIATDRKDHLVSFCFFFCNNLLISLVLYHSYRWASVFLLINIFFLVILSSIVLINGYLIHPIENYRIKDFIYDFGKLIFNIKCKISFFYLGLIGFSLYCDPLVELAKYRNLLLVQSLILQVSFGNFFKGLFEYFIEQKKVKKERKAVDG